MLLVVYLGGCAGQQLSPPEVVDFSATGKLALRGVERGQSFNFAWQQMGERYDVEVWGPLGQGRTQLRGEHDLMVISRGTEVLAQGSVDDIMLANLGWHIPVHALPFWMRGQMGPDAQADSARRDPQGRLAQFEESGWLVTLDRYRVERCAPGRITASRAGRKLIALLREVEDPGCNLTTESA